MAVPQWFDLSEVPRLSEDFLEQNQKANKKIQFQQKNYTEMLYGEINERYIWRKKTMNNQSYHQNQIRKT